MVKIFNSNFGEWFKTKLNNVATTIKMNGTQSSGSSDFAARADHVHPTDTSRAAASHKHTKSEITDFPTIPAANSVASNIKMDGTQSAGSLSSIARADHVHPTDTSRAAASHTHPYLPLAGGTMTGPLFIPTGNSESVDQTGNVPVSGSYMSSAMDLNQLIESKRSMMGSVKPSDGTWINVISARHANGSGSGVHGLLLFSPTLSVGNLMWKQLVNGTWRATKTILDTGNHTGGSSATGVPTANQSPGFGGTFQVSQPVSNATGHITAINSRAITIPSAVASASANGLMSKTDKSKLDSIDTTTSSGTVSLSSGFSGTVKYYQKGNVVIINCNALKYNAATTYRGCGSVPFNPAHSENVEVVEYRTADKRTMFKLTPSGALQFYTDDASYAFTGQLIFFADS